MGFWNDSLVQPKLWIYEVKVLPLKVAECGGTWIFLEFYLKVWKNRYPWNVWAGVDKISVVFRHIFGGLPNFYELTDNLKWRPGHDLEWAEYVEAFVIWWPSAVFSCLAGSICHLACFFICFCTQGSLFYEAVNILKKTIYSTHILIVWS